MKIVAGSVVVAALAAGLVWASTPDTKVEMKGLHLCCGSCEGAATKALEGTGAKMVVTDKAAGTLTFMVKDAKVAQKAFDGLAAAGLHGDSGVKGLGIKDDSGVKPGKIKTLKLSGVHNCCGGCTKPLKAAIEKVGGVTGTDLVDKATTFTVHGDFDGAELIKAINDAGYHAKAAK